MPEPLLPQSPIAALSRTRQGGRDYAVFSLQANEGFDAGMLSDLVKFLRTRDDNAVPPQTHSEIILVSTTYIDANIVKMGNMINHPGRIENEVAPHFHNAAPEHVRNLLIHLYNAFGVFKNMALQSMPHSP